MGLHCEAGLNRKFMEFAKILNIYLNHFPKHERYALANKIRNTAYDIYDYISEGQKRYFKKTNSLPFLIRKIGEANKHVKIIQIPEGYRSIHNLHPDHA